MSRYIPELRRRVGRLEPPGPVTIPRAAIPFLRLDAFFPDRFEIRVSTPKRDAVPRLEHVPVFLDPIALVE